MHINAKLCKYRYTDFLPWAFLLIKKLEIEKTKPIFVTSVLKVDIPNKVGLVFSNFCIHKIAHGVSSTTVLQWGSQFLLPKNFKKAWFSVLCWKIQIYTTFCWMFRITNELFYHSDTFKKGRHGDSPGEGSKSKTKSAVIYGWLLSPLLFCLFCSPFTIHNTNSE